jgi:hypothetical protein
LTAPSSHDSPIALLSQARWRQVGGPRALDGEVSKHDDKQQSLSINVGTDGRVLMKCHAGCDNRAIVAAIGLTMSALFVPGTKPDLRVEPSAKAQGVETRKRMVKSYDYTDANGTCCSRSAAWSQRAFHNDGQQRQAIGSGGSAAFSPSSIACPN